MRRKIELTDVAKKVEGLQTIESIMAILKVKKGTAVNYMSKLKKKGFVKYFSAGRKKRIYRITTIKPRFGDYPSVHEIINKYSKIKVIEPVRYIIHGRKATAEEAVVFALETQNFRLILASISLFSHIKNWKLLNDIAKKHGLQRQIGALYDLSRLFVKTRRMDKRTGESMLRGKGSKYIYDKIKTKEFSGIAKKWKVEIPFRTQDLIRLRTG